ncbi:MAG TPA: zinc ribbon domain-containing protein [Solirubrobacteraceae bacterium]|nr:zinc ribbon domain-containing protein [Solirubrobacteraceae bacterium]
MPIYDFCCPSCEERFEELLSFDAGAPLCPACGAPSERVISRFATPGVGRERVDFSRVPFERAGGGCCGGACAGHARPGTHAH